MEQVQEMLRSQFDALSETDIDKLPNGNQRTSYPRPPSIASYPLTVDQSPRPEKSIGEGSPSLMALPSYRNSNGFSIILNEDADKTQHFALHPPKSLFCRNPVAVLWKMVRIA